jgi:hypothetical protein
MPIYGPSASYPEHGIFVLWLPDNRAFVTTQMFAPRDGVFIMRAWSSFSLEAYEDRHFQMDAAYLRGLPYKPIMEMMQVAITMLTPAVYHREFRQALQNATMTHPADFCIPYDLNPRTLDTFE